MREPIDRKFEIAAMSLEHGNRHDKFDSVLFLAKDRALLEALPAYRDACVRLGADERQIKAVELLKLR